MALTLNDIKPIGLCITTQDLFDTKRFLYNYCDGLILRGKDADMVNDLTTFKRDLNSFRTQLKFLNGYKAIITSNIDKILGVATSRYSKIEPRMVEELVTNAKQIIKKTLKANNFEEILAMENEFKSKITLPVYELFIKSFKTSNTKVI